MGRFDSLSVRKVTGMGVSEEFLKKQQLTHRNGQQQPVSPEEKAEREASGRTQGRKGCKATRINMAFWSENHEFIRIMSKVSGKTMTEYTNLVIEKYRREHPDTYERAKKLIADLEAQGTGI